MMILAPSGLFFYAGLPVSLIPISGECGIYGRVQTVLPVAYCRLKNTLALSLPCGCEKKVK
ncbi:MAG: hypothetical protein KDI62_26075, partial [Anaerolineae bacterium]|nr:hypothetical protein [Anaerolineae bacterium]